MDPLKPSPGRFVLRAARLPSIAELRKRLGAAKVEPLPGEKGALVVTFGGAVPAAAATERLLHVAGEDAHVLPVLEDEHGTPLYPTGRLGVRFKKPIADPELQHFAARHDLELVAKNEFQPHQATFAPREPGALHLTERVEGVDADDDVLRAWPETQSAYSKSD